MATMKSFTDLEQSKKLEEILPIESADMYWRSLNLNGHISWSSHIKRLEPPIYDLEHYIPCWSLAALIEVMPSIEGFKPVIDLDINQIRYEGKYRDELCFNSNNLVDACVAMIEKLHELKLL